MAGDADGWMAGAVVTPAAGALTCQAGCRYNQGGLEIKSGAESKSLDTCWSDG